MQTVEEARVLARTMVDIGHKLEKRTVAIITDMNQPLGLAVGNGLEVKDAVDVLSGRVGENDPLYGVCMLLAEKMLMLGGCAKDPDTAKAMLTQRIAVGSALKRLRDMVQEMGGDPSYIDEPEKLVQVRERVEVPSPATGYIGDMLAERIGVAAQMLGAGRATKQDVIDPAVGLVMHIRRGDRIERG